MYKRLQLPGLPAGYAAESVNSYACPPGEEKTAKFITQGFLSSEDGIDFITHLDGLWPVILDPAGLSIREVGGIDRLLAVIHRDCSVDLYINEPSMNLSASLKMTVDKIYKDQPVGLDSIEHMVSIEFEGVPIPQSSGFFWVFSFGWRKGLLFDVSPLTPIDGKLVDRDYELGRSCAEALSYLINQELFKVSPDLWEEIYNQDWFPFIILPQSLRESIIGHARERWPIDQLEEQIASFLKNNIQVIRKVLLGSSILANHRQSIGHAVDRFACDDYISTINIVVPRIEGILRDLYVRQGGTNNPKQRVIVSSLHSATRSAYQAGSPIIPDKFAEYLERVFFQPFDHNSPNASSIVSRHTVAHGVVAERFLNRKNALLAIMTLTQITSYADRLANKPLANIRL